MTSFLRWSMQTKWYVITLQYMVLADVLETGYTVKNSILNEKLAKLAPEDRSKIYEVIDTLLKHSKQIAP